jgi:hypothetical protein
MGVRIRARKKTLDREWLWELMSHSNRKRIQRPESVGGQIIAIGTDGIWEAHTSMVKCPEKHGLEMASDG